jgi:hypothetical protein
MTAELVIARIRRALLLDPTAYEETRDDNSFTIVSLGAAFLAVLLGAIGAWLWAETVLEATPDSWFVDTVILGTIFLVILWLIGVGVMYLILAQLYGEQITPDGLLRVATLGHIPFALSLLVFIPWFGFGFAMFAIAATFFYTNFAIRSAYPEIDALRVVLAVLAGFAIWLFILPVLTSDGDAFAPGPFVYEWSADVVESGFASLVDLGDLNIPETTE